MVPKGKMGFGWHSFARILEEVIAFLGDSRRKLTSFGNSEFRPGVSYATVVKPSPPEKKAVDRNLHGVQAGDNKDK